MQVGDVLSAQQAYLLNKGPLEGEYDPSEYLEDDRHDYRLLRQQIKILHYVYHILMKNSS
jgi:hypothetical protein